MSGLSPQARSIIEASRGCDDPTPEDRKRIRSSLIVRLGAGAAAAGAATSAGSGAAAAGAAKGAGVGLLAGLAPKGLIVLSIGVLGVGAYAVYEPPQPRQPAHTAATASASSPEPVPAPLAPAAPADVPEVEEATGVDPGQPAPVAPPPPAGAQHEDASPRLADEVESLREAHTALREGRADEAMEVLDRDAAPASSLEQERAAMRVFALCRLGKKEEARRQAAAFLAKWPSSPHAPRVRAACVP